MKIEIWRVLITVCDENEKLYVLILIYNGNEELCVLIPSCNENKDLSRKERYLRWKRSLLRFDIAFLLCRQPSKPYMLKYFARSEWKNFDIAFLSRKQPFEHYVLHYSARS